MNTRLSLSLAAAAAALAPQLLHAGAAFAGTPASGSVKINDGTRHWEVSFTDALEYDATTGEVSLVDSAPSGWEATKLSVLNKDGTLSLADGFQWHTADRVNSSGPADNTTNPWASVISIYANGNVDPDISYAVAFKNNTNAVQTYHYSFGEAVSPTVSGPYSLFASISGGLTNAVGGTSATVSPVSGLIQKLKFSTDGGTTFFNAGADLGPSFTIPSASGTQPYGNFDSNTSGSLSLPIDYWQFDVDLTLTPGRDAVSLTGYAELTPIPEPGFYALVAGVAAFGLAARRRRVRMAVAS